MYVHSCSSINVIILNLVKLQYLVFERFPCFKMYAKDGN